MTSFLLWKTYKKLYITLISGVCTLFIFALTFVNSLRLRFLSIFAMRSDSSNSFRFNVYNSCLDMFKDNWNEILEKGDPYYNVNLRLDKVNFSINTQKQER